MDRRPPRRSRPGWPLVLLLLGAMGGFGWLGARSTETGPTLAHPETPEAIAPAAQPERPAPAPLNPFAADTVYILLVGTDVDVSAGRTDTMIVLAADFERQAVALLSVPRDTRVELPGHGLQKINAAFPLGGRTLCAQATANLVRKPIHHFLHCDLKAFQEAVDAIGGVTVDVEKRMYYRDRAQNLRIDLQPGPQRLDGNRAMQYVRYRKDKLGDLGRIQRQQTFLKAVAKELCRPEQLTRLPAVLQALERNLDTTLSVTQTLYLAKLIAKLGPEKLATGQLPGVGQYVDGVSYFLPDAGAGVAFDDLLRAAPGAEDAATGNTTSTAGLAPAVTIYNGSDRLGLERVVADELAEQGITAKAATLPTREAVADSRVYAVSMEDHDAATRFGAVVGVPASSNAAPALCPALAAEEGHPQLVLVLGADFKMAR